MQSINQVILNAIKSMFDKYKDDFTADKTYVGKIINVLGNKKYTILYNDAEREIRTKNEVNLSIGDTVHIVYPLGKENNKYMVEDVISSEESFSGVKTVDGQTGDIVLSNTYASKQSEHMHGNKSILDSITDALLNKWNEVSNKVDKVPGKQLSTNDYTDLEKAKLAEIASGAEVNIQSDWNITDTTSDAYIKNKPSSLPASDVPAWAKASTKPSYTPTEVGVIDTTPTNGQIAIFDGSTGKIKSSGYTINSSVPVDAKFTDTVYFHPTTDGNKHIPANGTTNSGKYLKATAVAGNYEWGELTSDDVKNALGYTPGTGSSSLSLGETSTTAYRGDWGKTAYDHSQIAHSPSTAEKNIIVGIQKNGTDLAVDNTTRKVNVTVPTKVSELTNDSGYKTTDNNTTYNLTKSGSTIILTGSDGTTTSVVDSNTTYSNATTSSSGLMSSTDKSKLDNIESGAQANIEINEQAPTFTPSSSLSTLTSGEKILVSFGKISKAISDLITHLADSVVHITSSERTLWNKVSDKVDKVSGKQLSTNDFSNDEKAKLAGIEVGANKFIHPEYVAGTAQGDADKTLTFGGTFKIPTVTYDEQGHITGKGTTTMTMPPNPNTDIKIGGKNLVGDTKDLTGLSYKTDDTYLGFNIARSTKGATGYNDTYTAKTLNIPAGSTNIVSFYAKASIDTTITCFWYSPNTTLSAKSSTGYSGTSADGMANVKITTSWKRYWVTWTQSDTITAKSLIVGRNGNCSEGTVVEIAGVKLEDGNIATDWTPAPEDIDSNISTWLAGKSDTSHTHNYAGSSSAGGAATTSLACTGNSATATKATQDSTGQQINTTYIKGLSVSGKTVTYTKGDGSTGTLTTQDTTYTSLKNPYALTVQGNGTQLISYDGGSAATLNITPSNINAVPASGGVMTGALVLRTAGTSSYNQGIVINRTTADQWALLQIGGLNTSAGTALGSWLVGSAPTANSYDFLIVENSSSVSGGLRLGGNGSSTLQWKGNDILTSSNYKTYGLPLSGGTLTGRTVLASLRGSNISTMTTNTGLYVEPNVDTGSTAQGVLSWRTATGDGWAISNLSNNAASCIIYATKANIDANNNTTSTVVEMTNGAFNILSGNAATATLATKATQDSAGQQINTTYIKSLSVSGNDLTMIKGDNTTSKVTISNTTYTAGTGLSINGTTINHSNSVASGTAQGDVSKTLTYGGTFTVPTVTYDTQGHVTGKGTTTMTMPAAPTSVSGSSGSCTGNAATATKLATPISITIGNITKTLDGSGNINLNDSNGYLSSTIVSTSNVFNNSGTLYIESGSSTVSIINSSCTAALVGTQFRPAAANAGAITLGSSATKWGQIYSTSSTISTSDRNQKKNIEYLGESEKTEKYEQLYMKLNPCIYMFNKQSSDRVHSGFISQDVEIILDEVGLTPLDFAAFCKDEKVEISVDEDKNEVETVIPGEYEYSLRYEEFIALNTHMIQKTIRRIEDQEERIKELETVIEQLKNKIIEMETAG